MDSHTLTSLGFCSWQPFPEGIKIAPQNKGCYSFRSLIPQSLKKGSSDIMCIGRARSDRKGAYYNIRHALNEYHHPGRKTARPQVTKIRVGDRALASGWQISWKQDNGPDVLECQLLQRFYEEHDQLPPENKSWPPGCGPKSGAEPGGDIYE